MSTIFAYCFDENLANELLKSCKLLKQEVINGNNCWIFVVNNKLNFSELDKSKIIISNRLNL